MVMIDSQNLSSVLAGKGVKLCVGLENRKCFRPRREKGRLCADCHRVYMREYMAKQRGKVGTKVFGSSDDKNRMRVIDGYDFSQENI